MILFYTGDVVVMNEKYKDRTYYTTDLMLVLGEYLPNYFILQKPDGTTIDLHKRYLTKKKETIRKYKLKNILPAL